MDSDNKSKETCLWDRKEVPRGAGRRHAPKGKGARAALAALREWRASLVEEAGGDGGEAKASGVAAMSMGDFMEAYWATRAIKKSTMKGYHNLKKHIVMLPGRACDVEPADVQQWIIDEKKRGVGAPTIKKSYVAMKSAFEWAVRVGYLERNPCTPVNPPKPEKRDPNPVDEPNLSKLAVSLASLDSNGNRQLADTVRLALFTGMRQGELCGMRWRDVDGAIDGGMDVDGLIHIDNTIEIVEGGTELTPRPKNGLRRDVPINVDVLAVLERRRREVVEMWGDDIGDYFVLAKPETPLRWCNPGTLQKDWRSFRAVAGICGTTDRAVHFHDLRHTFATKALVDRDIDLVTVAGLLGHANPRTTLTFYARWMPNANKRAMGKMRSSVPKSGVRPSPSPMEEGRTNVLHPGSGADCW